MPWRDDLSSLPAQATVLGPLDDSYTTVPDVDPGVGVLSRVAKGWVTPFYITRAIFGPRYVWDFGDAWDCIYAHLRAPNIGDSSQLYNSPPDGNPWSGSFQCRTIVYGDNSSFNLYGLAGRAGWQMATHADEPGFESAGGEVDLFAAYFDLGAYLETLPPWAPYAEPTPPPSRAIEWEFPHPEVVAVEATLAESNDEAATNEGELYLAVYDPTTHGFGPDVDDLMTWHNAGGYDNALVPGGSWGGAPDDWRDITPHLAPSGRTWFTVAPDVVAAGAHHGTIGSPSGDVVLNGLRFGVTVMIRLHLKARRYRWDPDINVIPPRRLFQRSDGVTHGARRVIGGGNTRQSGNRTLGGIL